MRFQKQIQQNAKLLQAHYSFLYNFHLLNEAY